MKARGNDRVPLADIFARAEVCIRICFLHVISRIARGAQLKTIPFPEEDGCCTYRREQGHSTVIGINWLDTTPSDRINSFGLTWNNLEQFCRGKNWKRDADFTNELVTTRKLQFSSRVAVERKTRCAPAATCGESFYGDVIRLKKFYTSLQSDIE